MDGWVDGWMRLKFRVNKHRSREVREGTRRKGPLKVENIWRATF